MKNHSSLQCLYGIIENKRHLVDNPNAYQKDIAEMLSKIPSAKGSIGALSILLQSKLEEMSFHLDECLWLQEELEGLKNGSGQ